MSVTYCENVQRDSVSDSKSHPAGGQAVSAGLSGRHPGSVEPSIRPPESEAEWRQATALLHDFGDWILAASGLDLWQEQRGFADEAADLAATYNGGDAAMFVAFDRDLAVGTVAVRFHSDQSAELKRMYVRRAARGSGLADRLVRQVIEIAVDRGCSCVWLETLRGPMDPAIAVYTRTGFVESPRRGTLGQDDIVVMEHSLGREART